MSKTADYLDSHTRLSSAVLDYLSSADRPGISDDHFCEAGYSEGFFFLVLAKFGSHIPLCLVCPIKIAYCQHSRERNFFTQWLTFATKNNLYYYYYYYYYYYIVYNFLYVTYSLMRNYILYLTFWV